MTDDHETQPPADEAEVDALLAARRTPSATRDTRPGTDGPAAPTTTAADVALVHRVATEGPRDAAEAERVLASRTLSGLLRTHWHHVEAPPAALVAASTDRSDPRHADALAELLRRCATGGPAVTDEPAAAGGPGTVLAFPRRGAAVRRVSYEPRAAAASGEFLTSDLREVTGILVEALDGRTAEVKVRAGRGGASDVDVRLTGTAPPGGLRLRDGTPVEGDRPVRVRSDVRLVADLLAEVLEFGA